jgi:hypothetical protein
MVRSILPGSGNTGGLMTPLIPFNVIVDTDEGLLRVIYKYYMDSTIFNRSFFEGHTINSLAQALYEREMENPLYLCINDEYKDSCDSLYKEFMETKYETILDWSVITEIYRLIRLFNNEPDIKLTIVCERQEEVDCLRASKETKDCKIILSDSLKPETIKSFNQFFFKSIGDAIPYTKYLTGKTIYFSNYTFNSKAGENDPILAILSENNVVNFIDVFRFDKGDKSVEDE